MPVQLPRIIQGGMGVAVSSWRLARAVSLRGPARRRIGHGIDTVSHDGCSWAIRAATCAARSRRSRSARSRRASGTAISSRAARRRTRRSSPSRSPRVEMSRRLLDLSSSATSSRCSWPRPGTAAGRHQPAREDPVAQPCLAVRRDARGGGLRADGRGHPAGDPRASWTASRRRAGRDELDVAGALPGEEFCTRFDPRATCGGAAAALGRPQFLAHRLLVDAGH